METNVQRIKEAIETLRTYTDTPGEGVTRFTYSDNDLKARAYFQEQFEKLGLSVRVDAVGNCFARLEGSDPSLPPYMTGSHIDSVQNGGAFDGLVGTVVALEAIRVMVESGFKPKHPIEAVYFSEEEGSNFETPVMGSKALVGKLTADDLKKIHNKDGVSAFDMAKKAGFSPENCEKDMLRPGDVKLMLEVHIEQSVRLDLEGHTIGIVEGIAGLNWFEVVLEGVSNHAGATPMHLRQDPLAAAGAIIAEVGDMARRSSKTAVATVGKLDVVPNIPNAIPNTVRFTVDIRDITQKGIDDTGELLKAAVAKYAEKHNVKFQCNKIASSLPIEVKDYVKDALEKSAKELGLDYILMPSGAVHDSNYMAEVTDVGMIFVPSINGRSHVPEEDTKFEDIKAGADLLLQTLVDLAG